MISPESPARRISLAAAVALAFGLPLVTARFQHHPYFILTTKATYLQVMAFLWVGIWFFAGGRLARRFTLSDMATLMWVVWAWISTLVFSAYPGAVPELLTLTGLGIVYLLGSTLDPNGGAARVWGWLLAGIALAAALSILEALGFNPLGLTHEGLDQDAGPLINRNILGGLCLLGLPMALHAGIDTSRPRLSRLAAWGLLALLGIALLASRTRGAWIGACVVLPIYVLGRFPRQRAYALTVAACGLLLGAGIFLAALPKDLVGEIRQRSLQAFDPESQSIQERLFVWRIAFEAAAERPATGWGYGSFDRLAERGKGGLLAEEGWQNVRDIPQNAHCDPLEVLAETGVLGALIFGCWCVGLLVAAFRKIGEGRTWALPVACGLVGTLVHGLLHWPLKAPSTAAALFLGAGLLAAGGEAIERIRWKRGWIALAGGLVLAAVAVRPFLGAVCLERASRLREAGDIEGELAAIEASLGYAPYQAEAYGMLGVVRMRQERIEDALAAFDRGIEMNPYLEQLHINRWYPLIGLLRLNEAEEALRRARKLNPRIEHLPAGPDEEESE